MRSLESAAWRLCAPGLRNQAESTASLSYLDERCVGYSIAMATVNIRPLDGEIDQSEWSIPDSR